MTTLRNIRQTRVTTILNNVVDKDVTSMLLPLNLMQYIMFCPKYRIKNNCITPNGFISNVISIIVSLVFMLLYVRFTVYTLYYYQDNFNVPIFVLISTWYDVFFHSLGFIMNCVIGIVQSKKSVKFVLTLQKVHRFLVNETSFKQFIVWNWIIVVVVLWGHLCIETCFGILTRLPIVTYYSCYIMVFFDFNIIYGIRVIKLLEDKVLLWSTKSGDENSKNEEVFQVYVDILDCYDIYKDCFQYFVSTFHFFFVTWPKRELKSYGTLFLFRLFTMLY